MSDMNSPRVFVPPPLIIGGTLLAGLWLDGRLRDAPALMLLPSLVGSAVIAFGLAIILAALGLFRKAETRPEPWQAATTLVRSGVYRFTRNPMYLGMLLTYAGVALALQSPTAGLLLLPLILVIDRAVVAREETYLARRFGPDYERYRGEVRRWL